MKKGILYGIAAYAMWGFFPIYWKLLHHVPALQLLGHRVFWSFVLLALLLLAVRLWRDFRAALTRKVVAVYAVAAVLLAVNWLTYVWAVNAGFIVETSLGYFINPLLSVLLGVVILRERLRLMQWIPLALAAAGVIYLTVAYGKLPWIALTLAFSFGFYGLLKKLAPLSSLFGLTLETGILLLPACIYLVFEQVRGTGAFLHTGTVSDLLMVGAGIATTIPLLLFASAAHQIPLTTVGLLQYIAPTIQFMLGVFVYREPFDHNHLIGFGMVWLALAIFWLENFLAHRVPVQPIPEMGEG
ncbi:MAG TPA: EamA family transporter RarD [Anaerolineales bacterium]